MPGRSPAATGRRRSRSRGWSSSPKGSSRRRPQSPGPSCPQPLAQLPPLPPGTEVEVRVDDDGFHGSWFEATVDSFIPSRGRGHRPRYTVTYSHLLSDDSGATLVEPFAPSRIRPRPPPPATTEPLRLHEIVEAFHNDGWWSGIVLATEPLTVAFPITREVITFQERHHVRPRRDYVDGQWVPSQAAIAVQPKRAVRVYTHNEKVEVVRDRPVYGYSWFPAKVEKVIDGLSYLIKYLEGEEMEYLHCLFIRPAVEHSVLESEFRLGPGAPVEAYCDGAWSPGVVLRHVITDGDYEVCINGKEEKMLPELLKPQYMWNGKHWKIVSAKRQGNRQQSLSGKRPSSPVELASSDDEHIQSWATKRSRKELPQKKPEELTGGSQHALESTMDTTVSALRKSLASSDSPKSCSPKRNNFQVLSQRIVSSCAAPINGLGFCHASSEHPTPQHESRSDVQIQLKGNSDISCKEIICALSASACNIPSPLDKKIRVSNAVSRGAGSGSNPNVFSSKKSGKQSFIATSTMRKKGTKKVAQRLKESLMELEGRGPHTPQQLSRNLEMHVNEGTNQELLPIEPPGFRSIYNEQGRPHTPQQLSRNLEMNVNEGTNQELLPIEPPGFKSICNEQGFLDGEHVDEEPIHIGSSECTMNDTPLRSYSVVGSSLFSTLPSSHISGQQCSLIKISDVLHLAEKTMEVFRKVPQRPHFRPLEKHAPELREGIAIGLKLGYANLVDSVNNSSIEDSIASFEGKISALTILEENGFEVKSLHHILNKLLEAKLDYSKHVGHRDKLKELVPRQESTVSQKHALLNEKEKTAFQLQQKLDSIRREADQIARERENEDAELLRLKAEVNATQEACSEGELRFRSTLAELRSRLQLSD
ncbi:DUF724 domain-containing protein 3 isoform X2 [Brachypodium distachyon]|uniref:DUF724 domain-containing protein 3 isoform X2 n=1 Tax=Brachypodium distachyon TaxID=15368 RepID=UPI00052FFAEE|nr:DUF724 domain-containing protein 3 isoform X2 [Brachypodium distachyon]|eukprot:XP_010237644.1 DUF724 domain-containing protein 3 isoform X2 [Brachypodium distachyon]